LHVLHAVEHLRIDFAHCQGPAPKALEVDSPSISDEDGIPVLAEESFRKLAAHSYSKGYAPRTTEFSTFPA
jgi:hypothetical protein